MAEIKSVVEDMVRSHMSVPHMSVPPPLAVHPPTVFQFPWIHPFRMELEDFNRRLRAVFDSVRTTRENMGPSAVKSGLEKYPERYNCDLGVPFSGLVRPILESRFPGFYAKYKDRSSLDNVIKQFSVSWTW